MADNDTENAPADLHEQEVSAASPDVEQDQDDVAEPLLEASPIVEGKRARKSVERLVPQAITSQKPKHVAVQQGQGDMLGDNERACQVIGKQPSDKLRQVHRLLYDTDGTKSQRKKEIRHFNGWPSEAVTDEFLEKKRAFLDKRPIPVLRQLFCAVFDIPKPGSTKGEIIDSIVAWCVKPSSSGRAPKKTKRRSTTKKRDKKPGTAPVSGFHLFAREATPSLKAEHEGASAADIMKLAKANWDALDEARKAAYKEKAAKARTESRDTPRSKASPKKRTKPATSAGLSRAKVISDESEGQSSSEDSDSDDDDDEPLLKKAKPALPSDSELRRATLEILKAADLTVLTKKKVRQEVQGKFAGSDLTEKKAFLNGVVDDYLASLS